MAKQARGQPLWVLSDSPIRVTEDVWYLEFTAGPQVNREVKMGDTPRLFWPGPMKPKERGALRDFLDLYTLVMRVLRDNSRALEVSRALASGCSDREISDLIIRLCVEEKLKDERQERP